MMAEWIVRKKSSFSDNYYFQQLASSPKRLMNRISQHTSLLPEEDPNKQDGQRRRGAFTIEHRPTVPPPSTQVQSNTMSGSAYTSSQGYSFHEATVDLTQPDAFSFHRSSEPVHFQARSNPMPDTSSRPGQPPQPQWSTRVNGSQMVQAITTNLQKSSARGRHHSNRSRNKLAAKESIRLEDRKRYAQLLQQFTSAPLTGTAFGSSYVRISHSSTALPGSQQTLLGTTIPVADTPKAPPSTSGDSAVSLPTPPLSVQPTHSLPPRDRSPETPQLSPGLTPHSFLQLQARRRARLSSSEKSPPARQTEAVQDLTAWDGLATPVTQNASDSDSPTIVKVLSPAVELTKSPTSEICEQALMDNKYVSEDWLEDMKDRFSKMARDRDREVREGEAQVQFFQEKREEREKQIEKDLLRKLRISQRVPAVVDDEYVESEEEEEEVEEGPEEFPELSEEQEAVVNDALRPHPPDQMLVEGFRLQLTRRDMATLAGLNWLNDEVINFYMNLLIARGEKEGNSKVHAFNTFFYPKVMNQGHSGVRRWTRQVDIFSKDYILVPVHLGMHWCLAVVDFGKKEIRYYDSMGGTNNACLSSIKKYLQDESVDKKKTKYDMSGWSLLNIKDIPQQMNGSDCGMFACKFAEYITRGAPITFSQEHMPYFRRRMVYEIISKQLL